MTVAAAARGRQLRYGELDRDVVVRGLLSLARRVGVEQVTMRGLAQELGTSAPAVYYHVANKQAALDLVAEALLDEVEIPTRGSWERRLTTLYTRGRAALLSVSGIATVLQTRPLSAAGRRLEDAALEILRSAGLDARSASAAQAVLAAHLLGSVSLEHSLAAVLPAAAPARARHFAYGLRVIVSGITTEGHLV